MFGISYGELFLILGATAALIGPKDLPKITRVAGRAAGRSIAYVQLARGHFDTIMRQSQASIVHKELQDTMAQLDAIRHEIRSLSMVNPTPFTRRFDETKPNTQNNGGNLDPHDVMKAGEGDGLKMKIPKEMSPAGTVSSSLHRQAMAYAKLAESPAARSSANFTNSSSTDSTAHKGAVGLLTVLPISAESAGLLPKRTSEETTGSDILLEAILEAEVATNAKQFFSSA